MEEKRNDFCWPSVIIVAAFCILASFGGGLTVQSTLSKHSRWILPFYGLFAGIFLAISAVILSYVLTSFKRS